MIFCNERRGSLPADVPFIEKVKQLGTMWKNMTEEEKQPYQEAFVPLKREYAFQRQIWDYCELFTRNK